MTEDFSIQAYLPMLVPFAAYLGTDIVKRIMKLLGKHTAGSKWMLPLFSVFVGMAAMFGLSQLDSFVAEKAPEWIIVLWGGFFGAAATGFNQMIKRGREGWDEYTHKL